MSRPSNHDPTPLGSRPTGLATSCRCAGTDESGPAAGPRTVAKAASARHCTATIAPTTGRHRGEGSRPSGSRISTSQTPTARKAEKRSVTQMAQATPASSASAPGRRTHWSPSPAAAKRSASPRASQPRTLPGRALVMQHAGDDPDRRQDHRLDRPAGRAAPGEPEPGRGHGGGEGDRGGGPDHRRDGTPGSAGHRLHDREYPDAGVRDQPFRPQAVPGVAPRHTASGMRSRCTPIQTQATTSSTCASTGPSGGRPKSQTRKATSRHGGRAREGPGAPDRDAQQHQAEEGADQVRDERDGRPRPGGSLRPSLSATAWSTERTSGATVPAA